MIEIHPLRERDKLTKLYNSVGVVFDENSIAIVASDGDDVLGFCLFDISAEYITVHHISPSDDIMFADGLLRSALHVGVENGVNAAFYSDDALWELMNRLGFVKDAKTKKLNMELLFSNCSSCGK